MGLVGQYPTNAWVTEVNLKSLTTLEEFHRISLVIIDLITNQI